MDGDTAYAMIRKITRLQGTCKKVAAFDPENESFVFDGYEKQDFQQPAAPASQE